jgi:hypothetical protein
MATFFEKLLGVNLTKDEDEAKAKGAFQLPEPPKNDGSIEVDSSNFLQFGTSFDYAVPEDEVQLITKYREMAEQMEFDRAINHVVNEFFAYDTDTMPVSINLENTKLSDNIKKKITTEFDNILKMLNFGTDAYEIFSRWYVDGRLYYQKVIDEQNKSKGILALKYIDPRKIRKVRKKIDDKSNKTTQNNVKNNIRLDVQYKEFYVYNPTGINNTNVQGLQIEKDSITYVHSGKFTRENKTVISHLHKAIRWFNVLRNIEDSVVIYRLSRASEKRVFNIELGDLPQSQAEAHMKKVIDKFRKRLSYNPQTGEVIEQKRFMTMLEDFWFAKRDGKGTSVEFLQGGQNLGEMEDVDYFKKRFYESLNVPITRLDPTIGFTLGRASEITREELAFYKFISRLRKRFSYLFEDILKTQLILKNILKEQEWNDVYQDIHFDYLEDTYFSELKETEIWQNRFNAARDTGVEGKLVSRLFVQKKLLRLTDEEIADENKQLEKENNDDLEISLQQQAVQQAGAPEDEDRGPQPGPEPKFQQGSEADISEQLEYIKEELEITKRRQQREETEFYEMLKGLIDE